MSLKIEGVGGGIVLVAFILGVMGLGAWLVVNGHDDGWWLIALPLIAIFL